MCTVFADQDVRIEKNCTWGLGYGLGLWGLSFSQFFFLYGTALKATLWGFFSSNRCVCAFNILGTTSDTVCRLCRADVTCDSVHGFCPKMSSVWEKLMVMKKKMHSLKLSQVVRFNSKQYIFMKIKNGIPCCFLWICDEECLHFMLFYVHQKTWKSANIGKFQSGP